MHSTTLLIGLPRGVASIAEEGPSQSPLVSVDGIEKVKTWNELAYNIVEAKLKRISQMTRTSMGGTLIHKKNFRFVKMRVLSKDE